MSVAPAPMLRLGWQSLTFFPQKEQTSSSRPGSSNGDLTPTPDRPEQRGIRATNQKTMSWLKDESGNTSFVKKWFGKAPWHRRESFESASSVTSSIREMLAGKTPPGTPTSDHARARFRKMMTMSLPMSHAFR